jgi:hypothetical protein
MADVALIELGARVLLTNPLYLCVFAGCRRHMGLPWLVGTYWLSGDISLSSPSCPPLCLWRPLCVEYTLSLEPPTPWCVWRGATCEVLLSAVWAVYMG